MLHNPVFSPDGTKIAYTTREPNGGGLWVSSITGGPPVPLPHPEEFLAGPSWSPDGEWIAVNAIKAGLVKIRVGSAEPPIQVADVRCGAAPVWSPDGSRILCSRNSILYTIPAGGGQPEFLGKEYGFRAAWSRDVRVLYVLRRSGGKREIGRLEWQTAGFTRIGDVPESALFHAELIGGDRWSLAPDGKSLAVTLAKSTGDIWLLEGFQPPKTLWQRLFR